MNSFNHDSLTCPLWANTGLAPVLTVRTVEMQVTVKRWLGIEEMLGRLQRGEGGSDRDREAGPL